MDSKKLLRYHLLTVITIFLPTAFIWILHHNHISSLILLFLGLLTGTFFLDADHFIDWFYLSPDNDESHQARQLLDSRQYRRLLNFYLDRIHHFHQLLFHHYFVQIILVLFSFFIFTSSGSAFAMGFMLGLNLHLLVHQILDFKSDPTRLQSWLFSKEDYQLPQRYLPHYISAFILINFLFWWLLSNSRL